MQALSVLFVGVENGSHREPHGAHRIAYRHVVRNENVTFAGIATVSVFGGLDRNHGSVTPKAPWGLIRPSGFRGGAKKNARELSAHGHSE
jgi:hypothetical protein